MLFVFLFVSSHLLYLVWHICLQVRFRLVLYGPLSKLDVLVLFVWLVCLAHHEYLSQFGPFSFLSLGLARLPGSLRRILCTLHGCSHVLQMLC